MGFDFLREAVQPVCRVVMEACVNSVSVPRVDRLVMPLGISGMTKDRIAAVSTVANSQDIGRCRGAVGR